MRKLYFAFLATFFGCFLSTTYGQSSANYTFAKTANGSLADMSSGTTQLVAGSQDDVSSPVTNIGFDFWYMGIRYTQFSVSSNGYLRLGGTAVTSSTYALGAAAPLIAAFGTDGETGLAGKIHYKLTGASPNRVLVIEYLNMTVIYNGSVYDNDCTYQINLYETSGKIEFVYGAIKRNSSTGYSAGMEPQYIGFSTSATAFATVTSSTLAVATSGTLTSNQYTLGANIAELNSTANGSRVVYGFTPSLPLAPSAANCTSVTQISANVNWTDNSSDEIGFGIFNSTDGGATYNYITTTAANASTYNATGLTPGTNYMWKIVAVKEASSAFITTAMTTMPYGNIASNGTGGGNWSSPSTWAGGVVPGAGDSVRIQNGDVTTIDVNANAYTLIVGGGTSGILEFEPTTARTLTILGNAFITNGGTFRSNTTGTQTGHNVSLTGNMINNGTLDFSTNANTAGASITFTGSANTGLSGTGAVTDLNALIVNKSTTTGIAELSPSNLTVKDVNTDVSGFVTLTNGILKISGSFTLANRLFTSAAYSISAAAGLWINNPNFTVSGQAGNATLTGMLRLSAGTMNIGTATGNSMALATGSVAIIEGGNLNVAGRFGSNTATTVINYTQTGGNVTVNTIGYSSATLACFDMGTSTSSVVNISNGNIIVQLPNTTAAGTSYRHQAGLVSPVAGGNLILGNANSGPAKTFNINGILPNVEVSNISAGHSGVLTATGANYYNNGLNIQVDNGASLNLGTAQFFFLGNSIVNNGTLTHNGASSLLYINSPNTNVTYSGTGLVTAPLSTLILTNDRNFTFDPASSSVTIGRIIIFSGSFVNADHIRFGNGGTSTAILQIGNTTTPTAGGTFDVAPAFNLGTGGQTISYLRTNSPITMGPEVNPGRILNNFTIDGNTNNVTLTGAPITVSGTLTLTTGYLDLVGTTLTLGTSTTALGTLAATGGRLANGPMKRFVGTTASNIIFPIGTSADNKNASINFTAAPTAGGSLIAQWIGTSPGTTGLPLISNPSITKVSHDGFWRVEAGEGLVDGTYTATFTDNGATDVTDYTGLVLLKRANSSSSWDAPGTTVAPTGSNTNPVIASSGLTGFSEFGIGGGNTALPLRITNITGVNNITRNRIDWKTFEENAGDHFNIERSKDGKNFDEIGNLSAKGNPGSYNFWDDAPFTGKNFYRLVCIDKNDKKYLSNTIQLNVSSKGAFEIQCYPNPAKDKVEVNITGIIGNDAQVQLLDVSGRVIKTWSEVSNAFTLDVHDINSGFYVIKYSDDTHTESIKINKN